MKAVLNVKGMHCKSCISLIKMALEELGIKANVVIGKAEVEFDDTKIKLKQIKEAIKNQGYEF